MALVINNLTLPPGLIVSNGNPEPIGQALYTTPGSYYWTVPDGVTRVSVVCVGAGGAGQGDWYTYGGGGGGGGLAYGNNIEVIPGNNYLVVVGAPGGYAVDGEPSYFISQSALYAGGGKTGQIQFNAYYPKNGGGGGAGGYAGNGGTGVSVTGDIRTTGGAGGTSSGTLRTGGGNGGAGGAGGPGNTYTNPQSGSGGAGAGGGYYNNPYWTQFYYNLSGGGVGVNGQGASGTGATSVLTYNPGSGQPGSNGVGSNYGGGSGLFYDSPSGGAVRIIWGTGRSFPSTLTTDQYPT